MQQTTPAIRFWCGVAEKSWYEQPVSPRGFACISPVYGQKKHYVNQVWIPPGTKVLQDSGAFTEACLANTGNAHADEVFLSPAARAFRRLSHHDALKRQEDHATRFEYVPTYRASYDVLIDEWWTLLQEKGVLLRQKRRWSETDAQWAVEETVSAAAYLSAHRNGIPCVLSAQGVSGQQYLRCVERILPYLRPEDMLGLGGWCITGKRPAQILPVFRETLELVIPFLGKEGVRRVHIWGVCYAPALALLLWFCDQYGIEVSTDSVGPSLKPVRGKWGYSEWHDTSYTHQQVMAYPVERHIGPVKGYRGETIWLPNDLGSHRVEHVKQVSEWLANFRTSRHYPTRQPVWIEQPRQLALAI